MILFFLLEGSSFTLNRAAGVEYFQPGYAYRHRFNPAFVPQWGYMGMPGIGNLNVSMASTMGLSDFLYPLENGKLGTFMHPEVSADAFLKNIRKKNNLSVGFDIDVLSAGWFWGRAFWSFDISAKGGMQMSIPYGLFEFVKKEMTANPSRYHIKDLRVDALAYMEVALGHSRSLNEEITVGGKLKFLVGTQMEMRVNRMDISLGDEAWTVSSDADFRVFGRLVETSANDAYFPDFRIGDVAPSGYGIAFDLGMEYKPLFLPGLRFSAAVTDLGFLYYGKNGMKAYKAAGNVLFDGFEQIGMDMDLQEEVNGLVEDMKSMLAWEEIPVLKEMVRMVNPTLNFGVEYGFWGNRFSLGLLNTTTFYPSHVQSELSLIANIHPARWFSLSFSYAFIGHREGFGWAFNITPKWGLNLFVASNYTPLQVNPQWIPLKRAHAHVQVGLTIPLGNNRAYLYDKEPDDVNAFPYSFRYPDDHKNRYEPYGYGGSGWNEEEVEVEEEVEEEEEEESADSTEGNPSNPQ